MEVGQVNRLNMVAQLKQAIMFDEFVDTVEMLQLTPGGRKTLAGQMSLSNPGSAVARDLADLNIEMG